MATAILLILLGRRNKPLQKEVKQKLYNYMSPVRQSLSLSHSVCQVQFQPIPTIDDFLRASHHRRRLLARLCRGHGCHGWCAHIQQTGCLHTEENLQKSGSMMENATSPNGEKHKKSKTPWKKSNFNQWEFQDPLNGWIWMNDVGLSDQIMTGWCGIM